MNKLIHLSILFVLITTASLSYASHKFHHPDKLMQSIKTKKEPGRAIYQQFCANCHAPEPLIEMNAPKFRHLNDWTSRLKQPAGVLLQHTNEGLNAMPPMGGCFECSETLLKQTIQYMLPKESKIKF